MKQAKPLSLIIQEAKRMTISAFNQVQEKTGLPAFLFEGILTDLLAQIREQKNIELSRDWAQMQQEYEKEELKKEGTKNE